MEDNILLHIQKNLKAPKTQFNSFGKYNYRNCEDILNAVKPLLAETETSLVVSDDMILVGNRYYIKATASLLSNSKIVAESTAFARETESKKGMDDAQVTGAASSYARKYALNGLFAIDDTKDPDGQKEPDITPPPPPPAKAKPPENTTNFQFLKTMKAIKERIIKTDGDAKMYYKKMGAIGFDKSNRITNRKVQEKLYLELKTYAKEQEEALKMAETEEPPLQFDLLDDDTPY